MVRGLKGPRPVSPAECRSPREPFRGHFRSRVSMKRNAVAWVALVLSAAALVSSRGVTRPLPAAPKISAESQKQAQLLSEAFGAVAEFARPSVVQISVEKKA